MSDAARRKREHRAREDAGLVHLRLRVPEEPLEHAMRHAGFLRPHQEAPAATLSAAVQAHLENLAAATIEAEA